MKGFLAAGGSIPGTDHTQPGQPGWKNNQDAYTWRAGDNSLVAVVSDGCGSTPHSEVGAMFGADLVARLIAENIPFVRGNPGFGLKDAVMQAQGPIVWHLAELAKLANGAKMLELTVMRYFLFSFVGVAMTPEETVVFSFGDGFWAVNGEVSAVELPTPENAPPYIGQRLIPGLMPEQYLRMAVHRALPTNDVQSVLIATDGLRYLPAESLSDFWEQKRFVDNPDSIRRRLAMINRERVQDGHIKGGPLRDDTTLVVVQREDLPQEA